MWCLQQINSRPSADVCSRLSTKVTQLQPVDRKGSVTIDACNEILSNQGIVVSPETKLQLASQFCEPQDPTRIKYKDLLHALQPDMHAPDPLAQWVLKQRPSPDAVSVQSSRLLSETSLKIKLGSIIGLKQKPKEPIAKDNAEVVSMQKRNEKGENKMMQFDPCGELQPKGKARNPGSKALLQADYQDYYPLDCNVPQESTHKAYRAYPEEEIKRFNTFNEASLVQDAQRYFKDQVKLEDRKGMMIDNGITKQRVDQNFLTKVLAEGGLKQRRLKLLQQMQDAKLDFRVLNKFKTEFFDIQDKTPQVTIPETQFRSLLAQSTIPGIEQLRGELLDTFIKDISTNGQVDLHSLFSIIDLFTYLPQKQPQNQQASPDMFRILTANQHNCATVVKDTSDVAESRTKRNLELILIRINERFPRFAAAFRFFDINFNNRVSFNEFSRGIEALKVKITVNELLECFSFLDCKKQGYISYHEFCGLSSERRDKQDPASEMLSSYKQQAPSEAPKSDLASYLDKLSFDDLILLRTERKSSKRLQGGPMVSCKLDTSTGQVKHGYSVPAQVLSTSNQTYGKSSHFKRQHTDMRSLINNTHFKETLVSKIKKEVLDELVQKQLKEIKIDPRNKASELRRNSALRKIQEMQEQHWTNFEKRSQSVLLPALSTRSYQSVSTNSNTRLVKETLLKNHLPKDEQEQILDKIHLMRLQAFQQRETENVTKPHVPLVNEDVRQGMIEDYFHAKRQLQHKSALI